MKLSFFPILMALCQIVNAQSVTLQIPRGNPGTRAGNYNSIERLENSEACDFDINKFTGLYTFYEIGYPEETSVVRITLDPEVDNGLVIKWLWSNSINSDTTKAYPFRIRLDPSDLETIYWDEQLVSSEVYGYGPGTANAGTGTYDPCTYNLYMSLQLCMEAGCFSPRDVSLEPIIDLGDPEDYYWVGGTGNWNDYSAHWATSSGGTVFYDAVPDANDNVYFDNSSFISEGDSVTLNASAVCGNFNYSSTVKAELSLAELRIMKDLKINQNIILKVGNLKMMDDNVNEFKTFNKQFGNIEFAGSGPFTITDSLKANDIHIYGTVNFSDFTECSSLSVDSDTSKLDISNSELHILQKFTNNALPYNFISENSTIYLKGHLEGTEFNYNTIIVNGTAFIESPNAIDTLIINKGASMLLTGSGVLKVNKLMANGTAEDYITIRNFGGYSSLRIKNTSNPDTIRYVLLDKIHVDYSGSDIYAPDCILKNGSSGWIGAKQYQEINFSLIENIPASQDSVNIEAVSSSGLSLDLELIKGDGTLENNAFYPRGEGMVEIQISQPGGTINELEYAAAEKETVYFQVYNEADSFKIYNYKEADMVIGQESLDTIVKAIDSLHFRGAIKCAVSSQGMFAASVMDKSYGRILLWKKTPDKPGQPADIVLGRTGFDDLNGGTSASLMSGSRGLTFSNNGNKLLVSDGHRVLIWNSIPDTSGTPADVVIGAEDFEDDGSENSGVTENRFNFISDLLITPDDKLLIADHYRILIYNRIPETNNASADLVIFQPDFYSEIKETSDRRISSYIRQVALSNSGKLIVAIPKENRVLVFHQIPETNDVPADYVLGNDDMFSIRQYQDGLSNYLAADGVAISNDNILAVGGAGWSNGYTRVLLYKGLPYVKDELPTHVLGQPNMETIFSQGNSPRAIKSVEWLTFDNKGHLYVCGRFSPRILVFNLKNDEYTKLDQIEIEHDFFLYPNPSGGDFTIKHNMDARVSEVSIYNLQGRLVYRRIFYDTPAEVSLNPRLKKGFYLVEVKSADKKVVQKLLVK